MTTYFSLPRAPRRLPLVQRRGGFTLVEVLATITLLAIVLPVAMRGVSLATDAADVARSRTEAAALAESKLNELVVTGAWQSGGALSGDCGADWPKYRWSAVVQDWTQTELEEIDVHVTWAGRNGDRDVVLSTLVYTGASATGSGSTGTGSTGSGSSGSKSSGTGSSKK